MKKKLLVVFLVLGILFLSAATAFDVAVYPVKQGTITAGNSAGNLTSALPTKDSTGTTDIPSRYLLLTAHATLGFNSEYTVTIPTTSDYVYGVSVLLNIKGADGSSWSWQFKNGTTWVSLGSFVTTTTWTSKTLFVPKALAVTASKMRIIGPNGKALKLDYMVVQRTTCAVDPALYSGTCPFQTILVAPTDYTYQLTQSTTALKFWTAPNTLRIGSTSATPTNTKSGLSVQCAKNEHEGFQLVIAKTTTASVQITMSALTGVTFTLFKMGFVNSLAEPLTPINNGATVTLSTTLNTGIYIKAYVSPTAVAGTYNPTLTVGGVVIPVTFEVFNFTLPYTATFESQFNIQHSAYIPPGGTVQQGKSVLYGLRWSIPTTTWPSGFSWELSWDTAANPNRCNAFFDEPNEQPDYSLKALAKKYINGTGWNGYGFSLNHVLQFVDNYSPRPSTFCGVALGSSRLGTSAYNTAWKKYLTALRNYLSTNGYLKKTYYYIQNEPQNQEEHEIAAFLCKITKEAAPGLRIAISEEAKPEIYQDPTNPCGYNIWIAAVTQYKQNYAWQRLALGEVTWFYTLPQDPVPFPNPSIASNQGVHQRVWTWASWKHRVQGYAYYNSGIWFSGNRPTLKAEIFREGFEDYEYFYKANGNARPKPNVVNPLDAVIHPVAQTLQAWSAEPALYTAARRFLGRRISNPALYLFPVVKLNIPKTNINPLYFNFQNTSGEPTANPLVVNGKTYKKVGWTAYSTSLGYGFAPVPGHPMYGTSSASGFNTLQTSLVYDDWGDAFTFEAAVPSGSYKVTVSVGWPGRAYSDPHNVVVEGIQTITNFVPTVAVSVKVATVTVSCTDGKITVVVGGGNAFTFLQYLEIISA